MLLDFSGLRGKSYNGKEIKTGLDISKWMLDEAGVGTVPGECFLFDPEEMLVRIALGYEKELIMGAMECLGKATAKIITQKPGQKVQDADSLPLLETKKFQAKL
jgi:aspartate/methionine/tyrosine aminotransferase